MKYISKFDREKIVWEEMRELSKYGLIDEDEFKRIMSAYQQHISNKIEQSGYREYQQVERERKNTIQSKPKENAKKVEDKRPKVKTEDQVRERNITWSLILGVIFLLIGGLVVATSTWSQMGPLLKVLALLGVAFFFLGLSGVSTKLLKLEKTAFAFLTLGSLLLPIVIIAIGYFNLFGAFLSLTGQGRFLLGLIGTLAPLPLYLRNAWVHQSRLFVWISYLFMTFSVGFLIGSFHVSIDVFYLLIMVYNGLLLFAYHRNRANKTIELFVKELPKYAQLNLVLSTLLMLVVFDQALFYSFNILLTAALYIAMVFVYNTKKYQFVFSALFAYGAYQLTESSWLVSIDLITYGFIGAAFLVFAYLAKSDTFMARMFHYTSGVISLVAFIYISYQGIIIRAGEDTWVLLAAYFVITCTYIYLTFITKRPIFSWLAAIFIYAFGIQLMDITLQHFANISSHMFLFVYAAILFWLIGIRNTNQYLQGIKRSVFYLSVAVMVLSIIYGVLVGNYLQVSFMFLLFGILALLVVTSKHKVEREIAKWTNPVSWLVTLFFLFPKLAEVSPVYSTQLNIPFHIAISAIVLLIISVIWNKYNKKDLSITSFYIGQGGYLYGLTQLMNFYTINGTFIRPALLLIGIALSIWLVRRIRMDLLWLIVAVITFAFYVSLIRTFSIHDFEPIVIYLLFSPILLLLVDRLGGKALPGLKPYFFWLAQGIQLMLVVIVLVDQALSKIIHPLFLLIPFVICVYSTLLENKEWQIKLLLYGSMTIATLTLTTNVIYYGNPANIPTIYCWFGSSLLLYGGWLLVSQEWKKRMEWYIIPFSTYGLFVLVTMRDVVHLVEVLPMFLFVGLNIFFWHKRNWTIGLVIPLTLTILVWEHQRDWLANYQLLVISLVSFVGLFIIGKVLFKRLYLWDIKNSYIDWYSVIAVFYLGYAITYMDIDYSVWIKIIPFLLLSIWLFGQVKRFSSVIVQKVTVTIGAISFLPSYYAVLQQYIDTIPVVLHAELKVLPILILSILLSIKTWRMYKRIMTDIQSTALFLITVYLVIDAIQSNTIWDALIIGILSLLSLLVGMQLQIKSYFFIGFGTLLFNVMYQTKPYWGNMPWWGYLLIAGVTLIGIASYNEWKKQKNKESQLEKKLKHALVKLKEWN